MAAAPWIISNWLVSDIIVPFLLVFVLVFALLDRTKILGEGKRQINALVSLAIGLIFITFTKAVLAVQNMIPFLAVAAVIILIFLILYGFVAADKEGLKIPNGIKITAAILIFIGLVVTVLVATGYWDTFLGAVSSGNKWVSSLIFLLILGGAIAAVLALGGEKK